jgi:hypothetical protein
MLEEFPDKPKGMHWRTYERWRRVHDVAEERSTIGLITNNGAIDGALCGQRQEHRRGLPVHRRAGMASAWLSPDAPVVFMDLDQGRRGGGVHAYDNTPYASRGLTAALRLAKVAPSSPHALQFPAHIFNRMGLWQESIATNQAGAAVDDLFFKPHAMDFLVHSYLQTGQAGT